jgi:hypothetical protein
MDNLDERPIWLPSSPLPACNRPSLTFQCVLEGHWRQVWWPVIPAFGRLQQEDYEFKTRQGYRGRASLKKQTKRTKGMFKQSSSCLAGVKPWVQTPQSQKKKKKKDKRTILPLPLGLSLFVTVDHHFDLQVTVILLSWFSEVFWKFCSQPFLLFCHCTMQHLLSNLRACILNCFLSMAMYFRLNSSSCTQIHEIGYPYWWEQGQAP